MKTIDWKEIKDNYPKSLIELESWYSKEIGEDIKVKKIEFYDGEVCYDFDYKDNPDGDAPYSIYLRKLYDFFDYNDIYMSVSKEDIGSDEWEFSYTVEYLPKEYENAKRRCPHFVTINSFNAYGATYSGAWSSRGEAEMSGFVKCFEILESIL